MKKLLLCGITLLFLAACGSSSSTPASSPEANAIGDQGLTNSQLALNTALSRVDLSNVDDATVDPLNLLGDNTYVDNGLYFQIATGNTTTVRLFGPVTENGLTMLIGESASTPFVFTVTGDNDDSTITMDGLVSATDADDNRFVMTFDNIVGTGSSLTGTVRIAVQLADGTDSLLTIDFSARQITQVLNGAVSSQSF